MTQVDDPITALCDPDGLGAALGDPSTFGTWFTVIKAGYALPMTRAERQVFDKVAGGRKPPRKRVRELWVKLGRRCAKTLMASALATYEAAYRDHSARLRPGQKGIVALIAPSKDQAEEAKDYCLGFLKSSPLLQGLVTSETAHTIRLDGNIEIRITSNSFRTVRGRVLLAVVGDEIAFWSDEGANPDREVYRACMPTLAASDGIWIGISSPYRRTGLLAAKQEKHFGVDDDRVLFIEGDTRTFNPTFDQAEIDAAYADDPEAARSEFGGEWRNDLVNLLGEDQISAAVDRERPLELPPRADVDHVCFADASAGRADAFAACVGHLEGDRFVADVVWARRPPFDPNAVAAEVAAIARRYRCQKVVGDNYAGEYTVRAFEAAGMSYERTTKPKSELYLDSVSTFARGAISIPNDPALLRELRLLERRVSRSGRDSVDHPKHGGATDDRANALVGALSVALAKPEAWVARSHAFSWG